MSIPDRRIVFVSAYDPANASGAFGEDVEEKIRLRLEDLKSETRYRWEPVSVSSVVAMPTNLSHEDGGHIPTLFLTIVVQAIV